MKSTIFKLIRKPYLCPFLRTLAEKDTFLSNVTNVSVSAITIAVLLHQQNYKK
jgi:hypothetical protein